MKQSILQIFKKEKILAGHVVRRTDDGQLSRGQNMKAKQEDRDGDKVWKKNKTVETR